MAVFGNILDRIANKKSKLQQAETEKRRIDEMVRANKEEAARRERESFLKPVMEQRARDAQTYSLPGVMGLAKGAEDEFRAKRQEGRAVAKEDRAKTKEFRTEASFIRAQRLADSTENLSRIKRAQLAGIPLDDVELVGGPSPQDRARLAAQAKQLTSQQVLDNKMRAAELQLRFQSTNRAKRQISEQAKVDQGAEKTYATLPETVLAFDVPDATEPKKKRNKSGGGGGGGMWTLYAGQEVSEKGKKRRRIFSKKTLQDSATVDEKNRIRLLYSVELKARKAAKKGEVMADIEATSRALLGRVIKDSGDLAQALKSERRGMLSGIANRSGAKRYSEPKDGTKLQRQKWKEKLNITFLPTRGYVTKKLERMANQWALTKAGKKPRRGDKDADGNPLYASNAEHAAATEVWAKEANSIAALRLERLRGEYGMGGTK